MFQSLVREETGTASIEYALIAGLVSVAIVVGAALLGANVETLYNAVVDGFEFLRG